MSHTRILNEMEDGEVTFETLKQVVNWKVAFDPMSGFTVHCNGVELARADSEEALVNRLNYYFFLEGNAFSSVDPDEVYACRTIKEDQPMASATMSTKEVEQVYERIVRGLPDFDENNFGEWYLAVGFADDVKFVYVMYMPDDGECKWYMARLHNRFTEHSW